MAEPGLVSFRDRIVELRRVPASELRANPLNFRRHPKAQTDALRGVLQEVGYAGALLARQTPEGLVLLDGHARKELSGDQAIPVLVLDVTEAEGRLILATYDPLGAMAETSAEALEALLSEVSIGDTALTAMMADLVSANAPRLPVLGFDGIDGEHREESVWNKMGSQVAFRKFEFGEFRCLISVEVHDALWQYAGASDNVGETIADVIMKGLGSC